MNEKNISEELAVPEGVEVKIEKGLVTVKGKKGECSKNLIDPKVNIELKDGKVMFTAKKATRREKIKIGSYYSHVKNMIKGSSEGHVYKLKVCSGHFPMNVSISGKEFVVKNFLGEKKPRTLTIKEGADVKVEESDVTVESCSKELAGQTAANIEKLTKITNRDLRIFQDGIYITEKDGKAIR